MCIVIASICCTLCLICLCLRYRARPPHIPYRVVVTQRAPQVIPLRMMAATTTTTATTTVNNTTYNEPPPAYVPDSVYRPCTTKAPPPAEDPNH